MSPYSSPLLVQLVRLLATAHKQPVDSAETKAATHSCLIELLKVFETLLSHADRNLSVRQLVLRLMKAVPVKANYTERWGDLTRVVRECAPLGLLDHDCTTVGDQFSNARSHLDGTTESLMRKLEQALAPNPEKSNDGPTSVGVFSWNGREYEFSKLQWRLLNALWDAYPNQVVEEEAVRAEVYDRRPTGNTNALWQLQNRTQNKLDEYRLPFVIHRVRDLTLQLKKRGTLTRT